MATAIVSTGLFQFGHRALSDVLLVISCAAFALLLAAYTWRFLGYRAQALAQAEQANDELRELAHGILPGVLDRGLAAGVEALVSRAHVRVSADVTEQRFASDIEASAYFIVAEALTNVAKHAQARTARVTASVDDGDLQIALADDGVGGARPDGRGLIGLRDRVAALGGRLRIDSPPGGGTRITASLPLDRRR